MISNNFKKRSLTSFLLFLALYFASLFDPILLYLLIIIGVISVLEFINICNKIFKNNYTRLLNIIVFIIYLFAYCSLFFYFSKFIYLKIIIFSLLLGCIASYVGGYVFGNILKGPKISKISPNKTISGSIGSIVFCCVIFSGLIFFFTANLSSIIIFTGIFTSIFCQLGDLFFSYLKRKAKIKDTGNYLPGHGGLLDRVDGILLGVPMGFIVLSLFLIK